MRVPILLVADYANIATGGKLNVMGIFSVIHAASFPCRHPSLALIIRLAADIGDTGQEKTLVIRLLADDDQELMRYSKEFGFPDTSGADEPEFTAVLSLQDLVFPRPGRYTFVVQVDQETKGSVSVTVQPVQQQE